MSFVGVISDNKCFENIKLKLKNYNEKKINLIHINSKSIENIKNIRFETIIADCDLNKFKQQKDIIDILFDNAKYLIINTDINKNINLREDINIISYGLNTKAGITVSSITESKILIYIQNSIKDANNNTIEVCEEQINLKEDNNLKIYEILIIYIIGCIYDCSIIKEI